MDEHKKRGYLLENYRLFHLRTQGVEKVEYHYHEFCKLLFLMSGTGSYVVEGHRYLLQPGDVVLVGSRCVHCPELLTDQPYERVILYIAPEFLQQQSAPDCDLLEIFSGKGGHVLRLKENARLKLYKQLSRLEDALSGEEYGRTVMSKAALLRLLVQLGRYRQKEEEQLHQTTPPQNSRVQELMRYMDEHLAEELDIDRLAEHFYVSKYHMMRLFRQETGFTIHTYLLQRRLLHARNLMEGGMQAAQASREVGFGSYSSFTRAYGKYFGTTPTGRRDPARERDEGFE